MTTQKPSPLKTEKVVLFHNETIFLKINQNNPAVYYHEGLKPPPEEIEATFPLDPFLFVALKSSTPPAGFKSQPAKVFLSSYDLPERKLIMQAIAWHNWHQHHQFCGQCGHKLTVIADFKEKKCKNCQLSTFPNLAPAIIVLIKQENRILLARGPHFPKGRYSALAGFVDIGETAEEATHREVREEVNLTIQNLEYFGTQSWPFLPSSFMIAYTADYLGGQIKIDPQEIEDAKWFDINNLPDLPTKGSISWQIITQTVAKMQGNTSY
jgi:NAD+ diphosphatase